MVDENLSGMDFMPGFDPGSDSSMVDENHVPAAFFVLHLSGEKIAVLV